MPYYIVDEERNEIEEHILQYSFGFAKQPPPPKHMIDFLSSSERSSAGGSLARCQ